MQWPRVNTFISIFILIELLLCVPEEMITLLLFGLLCAILGLFILASLWILELGQGSVRVLPAPQDPESRQAGAGGAVVALDSGDRARRPELCSPGPTS